MTPNRAFILDENVLIFAQTGTNESGEPDDTCTELVDRIIKICHTIVIDLPLWIKYRQQLGQARHRPVSPRAAMLRILRDASHISGKLDGFDRADCPTFADESLIPQGSQDDVPLVRLAVGTNATLVTTDAPLRNDLESSGIRARYNLEVVTPEEALASLTPAE